MILAFSFVYCLASLAFWRLLWLFGFLLCVCVLRHILPTADDVAPSALNAADDASFDVAALLLTEGEAAPQRSHGGRAGEQRCGEPFCGSDMLSHKMISMLCFVLMCRCEVNLPHLCAWPEVTSLIHRQAGNLLDNLRQQANSKRSI